MVYCGWKTSIFDQNMIWSIKNTYVKLEWTYGALCTFSSFYQSRWFILGKTLEKSKVRTSILFQNFEQLIFLSLKKIKSMFFQFFQLVKHLIHGFGFFRLAKNSFQVFWVFLSLEKIPKWNDFIHSDVNVFELLSIEMVYSGRNA